MLAPQPGEDLLLAGPGHEPWRFSRCLAGPECPHNSLESKMRRRVVIASTAVAATAAAFGVSAAQASQAAGSGSAAARQAATSITVVERAVSDKVIDVAPKGDSRGDVLIFANPVYNSSNSKKVGRDQGSCIRTVRGKAWQCSWTTRLAKGSLVVEGPFYDTRDSVLAITGGTGAYSRARGEMLVHARNAKGTAFTFKFTIEN